MLFQEESSNSKISKLEYDVLVLKEGMVMKSDDLYVAILMICTPNELEDALMEYEKMSLNILEVEIFVWLALLSWDYALE